MGYHIYAWLEEGQPNLQIVDARTKSVCVRWCYQGKDAERPGDKREIQRLFRELLLLTCKQELSNCRVFQMKPLG